MKFLHSAFRVVYTFGVYLSAYSQEKQSEETWEVALVIIFHGVSASPISYHAFKWAFIIIHP